ncbi:very short patch repair endonuclease [Azospirillum brasilense]|uniref:Very short patch repair endonuclease n=1 Tax=Azospirillum argentinense TaxID=2970906 RepID=A0A5B0KRF0_9PROT|nr:DNA mismatch endonuclease Vsr [Azospirillum argentinense]
MDIVDRQTRSKIMASVGQKDTGAELLLRKALHKTGLRYKLHVRSLPGSPDLVFPRFHAVVFVHGCYWHSHGCYRSTVPKSRREFWTEKFRTNRSRDEKNTQALLEKGWRVLVVWECALLGRNALPLDEVTDGVRRWLDSSDPQGQISPEPTGT